MDKEHLIELISNSLLHASKDSESNTYLSDIKNSLERLRTDYIDLYQVHWPERQTNFFGKRGYVHSEDDDAISIKETLRALNRLLEEGLVKQIGISNETPWGVNEYLKNACGDISSRIVTIQNVYNLLSRQFDL